MPSSLLECLHALSMAPAVLVTVRSTRGSVPREAGAWMAVFAAHTVGSVGGGHLEWAAAAHARQLLQTGQGAVELRFPLGARLGQCCGGEVVLAFERIGASDVPALRQRLATQRFPVALFGAGHVGVALVQVLGHLPVQLTWVDSRDGAFPPQLPAHVVCEHSDPVQVAVGMLAAQSRVLIMSFSHAEDFEVVAACLQRQRVQGDLPFVGLIGSRTKWASFRQRLMLRGFSESELAHVTCPIGVAGIADKRPEVIAVAVAAQLLQVAETSKDPIA